MLNPGDDFPAGPGSAGYWERRLTGSAGFPAGLLGAPAFQPAYWERRLSSRPTGSAGFPVGLLGAPAFQSASPDAGSMPASGDLAVGTTWRVLSRMFILDGIGSGLKSFAISYVLGTALSRAKDGPARKPAVPVRSDPQQCQRTQCRDSDGRSAIRGPWSLGVLRLLALLTRRKMVCYNILARTSIARAADDCEI
jgi:hypothetical protein